jgi:Transposase domain (DUF772)
MTSNAKGGNRQRELIPRAMKTTIPLSEQHPMVVLTDTLDWTEMELRAEEIRAKKLKNCAGRPPRLRALLGALTVMAVRRLPYRETEEQIRYYAPARYLCGLTETDWTPDFTTIQDFSQLLGEDGVKLINEYVVQLAVALGLADTKLAVADTTAQEAAIPHPTEAGLLASFLQSVGLAARTAGKKFKGFLSKVSSKIREGKKKVRAYRLFAKTADARRHVLVELTKIVGGVAEQLGKAVQAAVGVGHGLRGHALAAEKKLSSLHQTMMKLLPQIRHWIKTGKVATGKIINLHIPELYSIVRGKAGKAVEFGLSWGITRLKGGFILATLGDPRSEVQDTKFAVRAVEDLAGLFGKPPKSYAYDRGGYSEENIERLRQLGVRDVGLAPRGRAAWQVGGKVRDRLIRERAQVEGSIGTIKGQKYGFNRPAARSAAMMGTCGQRAVLGANLAKLVRGLAGGTAMATAK